MDPLRFATFTLDIPGRLLKRGERRLALRRQPFKVLAYLAERPGRLVTNRELIEACWENPRQTSVNSLAQCIKAIREALGETDHEIIRTIHGQGYVFAVEVATAPTEGRDPMAPPPEVATALPMVEEHSEPPLPTRLGGPLPRTGWRALAAAIVVLVVLLGSVWEVRSWLVRPAEPDMMAVPSIAVLPFEAVGEESRIGDAGALTDEVATELARMPRGYDLRIRSTSGYKLAGVPLRSAGRQLGVRYLVTGTVRRDGDVRQVNIQLVEAERSRAEWAQLFSYGPGEPGAQERTAYGIARALGAQVLRAESRLPLPAQPEAGHFVILGRSLMAGPGGREGNGRARAFFDQARALDPDLVPALLGYGRTRVNVALNGWAPADEGSRLLEEADSAIKHAAEIDSRDVGLQVLRGAYLRARGRDEDAIAAFQRAVELLPAYALAHAELGRSKIDVGLADEAVVDIKEAIHLSPNDPYVGAWYLWAGIAEAHIGHYEGAIKWLLKARNENRVHVNAASWLAVAHGGLEQWDEARLYLKEQLDAFPAFSIARWNRMFPRRHPAVEAQRARIVTILCRLATPGCAAATNIAR
jgi:DNA-binding winged helix-turn-helix (wHTH) protein/TolB-like protein/Tfp pilus assembly protein PilF